MLNVAYFKKKKKLFIFILILIIECRKELIKAIPGLRPWEVLSVEQAMDQITYNGEWYREPLGTYTTGPPYIQDWNEDVEVFICHFHKYFISFIIVIIA